MAAKKTKTKEECAEIIRNTLAERGLWDSKVPRIVLEKGLLKVLKEGGVGIDVIESHDLGKRMQVDGTRAMILPTDIERAMQGPEHGPTTQR